jgi:large subunit ribosomal protein L25
MPNRPSLAAASRTVTGKKVALLRREGLLPAVVYGHGTASEPVTVDAHEFELLRRRVGASTLVDLEVDGKKSRPVIVHGIQVHPITRKPIHIDLFAVRMTEELTVEVPLIGLGVASAVDNGGTLVHPVSTVKVRALPANLPESLSSDLGRLDSYEATITAADLVAPDGVTIQADPADVIARVLPPRVEEAPVVAEVEGEVPEGEDAEAEAPAEDDAAG